MAAAANESSPEEPIDALIADWLEAEEAGGALEPQEFIGRHPEFAAELKAFFADHGRFRQAAGRVFDSRLPAGNADPVPAGPGNSAGDPPSHSRAPTLADPHSDVPSPDGTARDIGVHELLHEIARGGMGVVFKGRDTVIGREIAIKVLQERYRGEPELLQRFIE